MTPGIAALLVGIFVVPALLLWAGHRLRRRPPVVQGAFWGAVVGHLVALVVGSVAGMTPAHEWSDADAVRGALGLWSFLVLPALGAAIGAATRRFR